jgi:glyoxylase-like metal-dependent hydrolase (beta-lactamase superfamily II)
MSAVVVPAIAAAPAQHTQAPGYYRTTVGDYEVTALYDGRVRIDLALLHGDPAMIQNLLQASIPDDPKSAWTSVAGFLVNTGGKLVLIDTGTGGNWGGPTTGELVRSLEAAGYKPEQVDLVLLTHLHADHAGGIYDAKGKRVFANAQIRMRQADSDFWLSKDIAAKAPQEARTFFQVAREALRLTKQPESGRRLKARTNWFREFAPTRFPGTRLGTPATWSHPRVNPSSSGATQRM